MRHSLTRTSNPSEREAHRHHQVAPQRRSPNRPSRPHRPQPARARAGARAHNARSAAGQPGWAHPKALREPGRGRPGFLASAPGTRPFGPSRSRGSRMPVQRSRAVLAVPGFRALWLAELLSVAGDQLARVALAVLVFGRTGSASWSALTYALTFLPALFGGVLLGGLADRFPRRRVMVVADLARAWLVAV